MYDFGEGLCLLLLSLKFFLKMVVHCSQVHSYNISVFCLCKHDFLFLVKRTCGVCYDDTQYQK